MKRDQHKEIRALREERKLKIDETANKIIADNLEAFQKLAK